MTAAEPGSNPRSPREPDSHPPGSLAVLPVRGLGEIRRGDDLAAMIAGLAELLDGDVVVVTQKIVSKAEGAMVRIDPDDPDDRLRVIESESVRILRRRGELVISETRHGFICANAGVDLSNVERGLGGIAPRGLRPLGEAHPRRAARRTGREVAVVVSDTFGRAWRKGVVDVAIGCAGVAAVVDLRGTADANGRDLVATEVCVADEVASRRGARHGQGCIGPRGGRARRRPRLAPAGVGVSGDPPATGRGPLPLNLPRSFPCARLGAPAAGPDQRAD